jgi:hypothetical protein
MRHLTDDIVLSVKDAMRNLRYVIRNEAAPSASRAFGGAERGAAPQPRSRDVRRRSHVARLVDKVFTGVETGALALMSPERDIGHGLVFPRSITDYFATGNPRRDGDAERLFARTCYHAAKTFLRGFGLSNMLISEHAIGRARDDLLKRHSELIRSVSASKAGASAREDDRDCVLLCSALTAAIIEARPIKEIDFSHSARSTPRGLIASANLYCFTVLGLATAIASVKREVTDTRGADVVDSANSVVDLRFQRFADALDAETPTEALAREFEEVLPFLP